MGYNGNYIGFNVNYNGVYWFDGFYWWDVIRQMGNNRTTVIPIGIMPKTYHKNEFCNCFNGNHNFCDGLKKISAG